MSADNVPSEAETRRAAVHILIAVGAFFMVWIAFVLLVLAEAVHGLAQARDSVP